MGHRVYAFVGDVFYPSFFFLFPCEGTNVCLVDVYLGFLWYVRYVLYVVEFTGSRVLGRCRYIESSRGYSINAVFRDASGEDYFVQDRLFCYLSQVI